MAGRPTVWLDVTFQEDPSRLRKGHGARNMEFVRKFAVSRLRAATQLSAPLNICCFIKAATLLRRHRPKPSGGPRRRVFAALAT